MDRQPADQEEERLWQAKEEAANRYEALQREREALDAQLRAMTHRTVADIPRWRDLVALRNQKLREVSEAAEAEERAALRWADRRLSGA